MAKKITITLEESCIDELSEFAKESGKTKSKIVCEALEDYFDVNTLAKTVEEYKLCKMETVPHDDINSV